MNKETHLQIIEEVIARMANNSLKFKEFALAIASICTTIIGISSVTKYLILLLIVPIVVCWFLDARYLLEERKYRKLYEDVRLKEEKDIDFNMSTNNSLDKIGSKKYYILNCLFSWSVFLFYLILIGLLIGVFFILK